MLGLEQLSALAHRAESEGEMWLCARYLSVMCATKARSDGSGSVGELPHRALDVITKILSKGFAQLTGQVLDDIYEVQLAMLHAVATSLDFLGMESRSDDVSRVLTTRAALRNPASAAWVHAMLHMRGFMTAEVEVYGNFACELLMRVRSSARTDPEPTVRMQCLIMSFCYSFVIDAVLCVTDSFDWEDFYGEGGSDFLAASKAFNYDTMHPFLTQNFLGTIYLL